MSDPIRDRLTETLTRVAQEIRDGAEYTAPDLIAMGRDLAADSAPDLPAPKPWWRSRAIWASVIAGIAGLAGLVGVSIDAAVATDRVMELVELADSLILLGVAALGWWGRVRAESPIDLGRIAPGLRWPWPR